MAAVTRIAALVGAIALAVAAPLSAQSEASIDVAEVNGPLDPVAIDFLIDTIDNSDGQLVIVQLDSPGAVSSRIEELLALVADPPLPVVVWAGPDPAVAQGGAAQLLAVAGLSAAAPGVKVGYLSQTVAGGDDDYSAVGELGGSPAVDDRYEVTGPDALVDIVVPSLGQLVTALDGMTLPSARGPAVVDTANSEVDAAGNTVMVPSVQVRFSEVSIWGRTLRLGIRPEAAFFFLVAGLTLAAFEFYAAGTGVMAVVAIASLFIAGYGLSELPLRWWAVAATLLGVLAYIGDLQRDALGWRSLVGTILLGVGGVWFTDAAPQISPVWWAVMLVVVGTALFFAVGMTAVVRSRFGTRTIGREHLIGRRGTAAGPIAPVGPVDVDGARWRAKSTRASGIGAGDAVEVVAVSGIELEVAPVSERPS
jgi:membrane-bound serine protease (ClpP class)